MKYINLIFTIISIAFLSACSSNQLKYDAAGIFEADEVIVSSELPGKILDFKVNEGNLIQKGAAVAIIDALPISLQQEQLEASVKALSQKTQNVAPQIKLLNDQIAVQTTQLTNLQHEQDRIETLLKADAATAKQLDDINFQIESVKKQIAVTQQQIAVQINNVQTQNRAILSETNPLEKQIAQLKDKEKRSTIINPINGTILTKYAMEGEITSAGKAMYKIADLSSLILRTYISGTQLSQIKIGQNVKVFIDEGDKKYKNYTGTITMVSDKAEFTPKTIQTKDERANLVYAVKVLVKNDGYLKIGMYGEIQFK
ncbi:MAG: HlyD family secretion protein [Bacteroidetes bacterium 24-39-8]|nr:MAG: HlyD family secretion protein [Bacteroidetes bacterium 24-39-8]HQS54528.1 efflux RND transporter periplasmic adaptor subunit [Sediminibacterium sp.]